ncbi:iron ABC transporter permease [Actinocorallia sp. A-T 12471]|uniref:FecCD family ABC transporter permease n=1 Tax=Actinocorallia sp. A-T 12471 TaxID=3089813 RepID=UPI0029D0C187|nr:iron ABC transporter permease [Actinocorallia sp. A-T 12471]MDX6742420.1 iron ABC transporter permease [Actinocorallia sp. A-T 12471]
MTVRTIPVGRGSPTGFLTLAGLVLVLPVSLVAAVGLGPVAIPFGDVARVIGHHYAPFLVAEGPTGPAAVIVLDLRLPRVILGAAVGAGLAAVGAVLQAVLRNPLADPYLLGASSGASFGAVCVLIVGFAPLGVLSLPVAAFAGAIGAFTLVMLLAGGSGRLAPTRLILAGVAVSALMEAVTHYLVLTSPDKEVRSALFWTLGGLGGAQWRDVGVPVLVVLAGTCWFWANAARLNGLVLGDEGATSLGVEVDVLRRRMVVGCALVVGAVVAVSGGIGFVALMVPHAVRLAVGGDNRHVVPLSALTGAVLLVWVDVGARTLQKPDEIPVGVLTALVGVPFFLALLRRADRGDLP